MNGNVKIIDRSNSSGQSTSVKKNNYVGDRSDECNDTSLKKTDSNKNSFSNDYSSSSTSNAYAERNSREAAP